MSITIRLFFTKGDRAKYISHLDITRCFARAIARTDLPVWYTEGFNPRVYMTFALPLPLGFQSNCESVDLRLVEDDFPPAQVAEALNRVLPEGIRVLRAALPRQKPEAIALADYDITLATARAQELAEQFATFAGQPSIPIIRHTKKGDRPLDLAPLVTILDTQPQEDALLLRLRLAAGTTVNLNPILLLDAFSTYLSCAIQDYAVTRTAILTPELEAWG